MKQASPDVFDEDYFYNVCFGSEEFKKSKGKKLHPRVKKMIDDLNLRDGMKILEIGTGRGDTAMYLARSAGQIIGIDYSKEAIKIAKKIQSGYPKRIQKKAKFYVMDASDLKFKDNYFDVVIFIDTIDHLNKRGVNKSMKEISRVLKPGGRLFIKTCSNNILLNYTFRYVIHPMNIFLTFFDKQIKSTSYEGLPSDPRTEEAKIQHVNESNYFYLKKLIKKFNFKGNIEGDIGFIKEGRGLRTSLYNFLITFYPISKYFPLNIFFAYTFKCDLVKK